MLSGFNAVYIVFYSPNLVLNYKDWHNYIGLHLTISFMNQYLNIIVFLTFLLNGHNINVQTFYQQSHVFACNMELGYKFTSQVDMICTTRTNVD